MPQYEWRTIHVPHKNTKMFAEQLQVSLNALESDGFVVNEIMDAPEGRQRGVIVIGKKTCDRPRQALHVRPSSSALR